MKILTKIEVRRILKPRKASSHKGDYGHALLIAGSTGFMGAAVISARACLRSGPGLLTVNVPAGERMIIQVAIPEAMVALREDRTANLEKFSAAGIGPGIGISEQSEEILVNMLTAFRQPMVLDADALNIIASKKNLLKKIPAGTILTPHPKEFDRLFGDHKNDGERRATAMKIAKDYGIIIVLKGHRTLVTSGSHSVLVTKGNAGLAKGGSGDALTGIITALLAQGYGPFDAAKSGVFLHGLAADLALKEQSMESMLISDVTGMLGKAFKYIMK